MTSLKIEDSTSHETELPNNILGYFIEDEFEYFNHFNIENCPEIIWKRPPEIIDDPCLLESYNNEVDGYIICGSQTPSWFPIIITLLKVKNLLDLVIKDVKKQDNFNKLTYNGSFEFSFFGKNTWIKIQIDDRLPHIREENKSLFCMSSNKEEFLPSLLEKAYARYLGGYGKLQTIDIFEVLMNFTGGIIEHIDLKQNGCLTYQDQKILFKKLKTSSVDTICVCCTDSNQDSNSTGDRKKFYLANDHYYLITGFTMIPAQSKLNIIDSVLSSILDFNPQESVDMLRLHNPVLNGDWNGPFSVGSLEWERINESVRRLYNLKFNHEFEFWITMGDFIRNMKSITLCHIPSYSYTDRFLKGVKMWSCFYHNGIYSSLIPGGSMKSLDNDFLKNDQYIIEVSNQDLVDIKLILSMNNIENALNYNDGCFLTLLKVESNRCYKLHDLQNSEILSLRILSESGSTYSVSATLSKGRYIVIPWRKHISEIEYYLRLYSSIKSINISFLHEHKPPFVRCMKCNVVKTLMKTKDMITNLSINNEYPDEYSPKQMCSSCISINPQLAVRITVFSSYGVECNNDRTPINSYFIIKYPNYSYKSMTRYLTNKPQWNESFIIYRTPNQRDDISIELFAEQKIGFDKSLGIHYFSETELSKDELVTSLRVPVNKEWVYTPTKVIVKFKSYSSSLFHSI